MPTGLMGNRFRETIRRDGFAEQLSLRQHPANALQRVSTTVTADEQDGYVTGIVQPLGGLRSIATLFEIDVHQYQIGPASSREFDSFSGVRGASTNLEAERLQRRLKVDGDQRFIFDD